MEVVYTAPEKIAPPVDSRDEPTLGREYTDLFQKRGEKWELLSTDYGVAARVEHDPGRFGDVSDGRARPNAVQLFTTLTLVNVEGPPESAAFVYGFQYLGGPVEIPHTELTVAVATLAPTGGLAVSWKKFADVRADVSAAYAEGNLLHIVTPASGPDDPACCATQVRNVWLRWDGRQFSEVRECIAAPGAAC